MSKQPIEEAKRWLRSAELNREGMNYSKGAYVLEMALEIALKVVLNSSGKNLQKRHDILVPLEELFMLHPRRYSANFRNMLNSIKPVFNYLMDVRQASDYGCENSITEDNFRDILEENYEKVVMAIETCDEERKQLTKN